MIHALAIDLGGTNLRGALVARDGSIRIRRETAAAKSGPGDFAVEQMISFCDQLLQEAKKSRMKVGGIGLGVAGFLVDRARIRFSPNLAHLKGVDIGSALSKRLRLPCVTENDGNCAALGEWWLGSAKGTHHALVLTLGTGVGGGLISDGRLIRGSHGSGGEVGHVCIDPDGPPCACGSNGCLEQFASGGALERNTRIPAKHLFEKAQKGDADALSAFSKMGRYLGIGLSSLCFLFDPEIVVLGGKVSRGILSSQRNRRITAPPSEPSGSGGSAGRGKSNGRRRPSRRRLAKF